MLVDNLFEVKFMQLITYYVQSVEVPITLNEGT